MVAKFPYTIAPGPLSELLEKLKNIGVPDKIDQTYLAQIGFSSSNHRPFIPIMKHVGLLDGSGVPTDIYRRGLRGGEAGKKLVANGIREGYRDLFATYPDAATRPTSDITTFVKTHTDLGDKALRAAVTTFQTLCKFGDFDGVPSAADRGGEERPIQKRASRGSEPEPGSVTINVNIALSVDATSDPAVYDAFFSAMAKHLKVLDGSSSNAS
jgi:hypothetical protein